ncbi:hypothetical protein Tco_0559211 [Tanacetum coccineum]
MEPSDAMHNPPQLLKVRKTLVSKLTEITLISIDFLTPIRPIMKGATQLQPPIIKIKVALFKHAEYDESNTYVLERFNTSAGNPVKKILLKLNLSDHRLCKIVVEISLAIAANLSELELKKILIEKMESNKSIHRSNEQKNLYKALVEAYKSDKLILDTYGDTVSFKRRRDDEDKDEEPSAGSNRGSKRRRARKEPESTSALKEKTSKTTGKSTDGSKSQHKSAGESAHTEEPMHTDKDLEEPAHQEFDIGATEEQSDEETSQHP